MRRIVRIFADFGRILRLVSWESRLKTAGVFVLMVMQSALELLFVLMLSHLASSLIEPQSLNGNWLFSGIYLFFPGLRAWTEDSRHLMLLAGGMVVLVSMLKTLICFFTSRVTMYLSERISYEMAREIMARYLHAEYAWIVTMERDFIFQRMLWRLQLATIVMAQLSTYACGVTVAVLFAGMVGREPVLTGMVIGTIGVTAAFFYRSLRRRVDREGRLAAESQQEETRIMLCATRGFRDIRIHRQQGTVLRHLAEAIRRGMDARAFNIMAPSMPTWVLETTGFAVVALALSYLVFVEHAGIPRITEALAMLLLTAWRLLPYVNRMMGFQVTIRAVRPMVLAVLDLLEVLRERASVDSPPPARDFSFLQNIVLRHVAFRYPGADDDCLRDICLELPAGGKLGIIGPSGSGKSTLAGILAGLLAPSSGEMLVDGVPLDPGRAAAFASQLAYVPQNAFLLAGSLAENVAFSEWGRDWNEQRVADACKKAGVDFVEGDPRGYGLPVGENGEKLSGGQAQRVAIARALYAAPRMLVLDEATSALDNVSENAIRQTIDSLGGVTCVIVAHRLYTLENCDFLVWLDKGRIVMQGKPTEVLARYRKSQDEAQKTSERGA